MDINQNEAVLVLSALGHDARLKIYRLLMRSGNDGLNVGEIAAYLKIPASTLAHHLNHLVQAGLVVQTRKSRTILNQVNFDRMNSVVKFLTQECCAGVVPASDVA